MVTRKFGRVIALALASVMMFNGNYISTKAEENQTSTPVSATENGQTQTSTEINNMYVDELSNYYVNVPYNMQFTVRDFNNAEQTLTLTLAEPCSLMISFNSINAQFEQEKSNGGTQVSKDKLRFTMYSDANKLNKIKTMGSYDSQGYAGPYYLDAGTYYISVQSEAMLAGKDGVATAQYCIGAVIERSASNEQVVPSSYVTPNQLVMGGEVNGFVSEVYKTDYYTFTVDEPSLITIEIYRQNGKGTVRYDILDLQGSSLESASMSGTQQTTSIARYLPVGQYYFRVENGSTLSGISTNTVGEGGRMKYKMYKTIYDFEYKFIRKNNNNRYVTYDTKNVTNRELGLSFNPNFDAQTFGLVKSDVMKVTNDNLDLAWDKTFASGSREIKDKITENGTYYILAKDKAGNSIYKTIKITCMDTKAPGRPVVKKISTPKVKVKSKKSKKVTYKYKGYSTVSGTAEKNSKITLVVDYRNSSGISKTKTYKATTNSKGKFSVKTMILKKGYQITLTATDKAGNVSLEREKTI